MKREGTPAPVRGQIRDGLKDSLGVGIGIFPLGFALGILIVQAGLPWWMAPALSIGIFAGSVELLLVSMLAAATPLITVAITVLVVNFRHVFYAFSFPIHAVRRGIPRAYSMYGMVDEAYATYVLMPPEKLSSRRMVTGQLTMQVYWVVGGLLGVLVASNLPNPIEGFEFALCALFVVMSIDAVRSAREVPSILLAGFSVTLAILLMPGSEILGSFIFFTIALLARYWWSKRRETRSTNSDEVPQ